MTLRVLFVDDEPSLRNIFKRLIEQSLDADVSTAGDGAEALKILRSQSVDLLISDVSHPVLDGVQMLKGLQADPVLRRIPTLIQSGTIPQRELEIWRAGARGVLQKPFTVNEFFAAIDRLVGTTAHPDRALLELGSETQVLDYKASVRLTTKTECASIAKDVIAFANTGGGTIIVGVAEVSPGRFEARGITRDEQVALETTRFNRAVRNYLDPAVPVRSRVIENRDRCFAFLEVPSAEAELVMAKTANQEADLFKCRIYGRTAAAESAALESAAEIRAVVSRLARNLRRGSMPQGTS